MIEYDAEEKRMVLKLVYFGPALSGKTTNLLHLHELLDRSRRGDLVVLDTRDDRTILFDLLPFFFITPAGLKLKVKVFTVPGHVRHNATRKAVLARADGVAFIADSQRREAANNRESFSNLEENLAYVGSDIDALPLVIQFNKRDLADILPEEEIRATWDATGIPVVLASALRTQGVVETFKLLLERTWDHVDRDFDLAGAWQLPRNDFVDNIVRFSVQGAGGAS